MGKITAIDLGSNTFRAALFDCEKKDIISSYEKTVRTAQGLRKSGRISQEALGRIIDAALMMPPHFYAHPVRAVTTQALRKAANAKAVLKEIKKHTGIDFCVISGEKEASLTLDAVQNRLEKLSFGTQSLLLADIGGGSTEIIIAKNGRSRIHSFEIGIVGIAEYGIGAYEQEFDALKRFVGTKDFSAFVCTAGTPTTVA
ncbi:MAG: phosphatase, partial [Campylobacterota bacterium]